ncbi:MAG: 50S ribosomal protein L10 [archaeon]
MEMHKAKHVAQWKLDTSERLAKLIEQYPVVAVLNLENLPARQLQKMRENLREQVVIIMTKRTIIKRAIEQSKKENVQDLAKHLKGMPALLFSKESPFKLFAVLKKNKSASAIKGGQTAPNDIVVPAGPTSFAPGPVIGELGQFRIKAGIENGKVAIKEDCVVAKEGTVVNAKLAGLLTRLGIEPMEIGLDLVAAYEKGEILTKSILDIDTDKFVRDIQLLVREANAVAIEIVYTTKDTAPLLLGKAHKDAFVLAVEQGVMTDATKELILAKAEAQAAALQGMIN